MLEVNNLSVTVRNGAQLLNQISFQIKIGEAIGLTGQSGAGKTTLTQGTARYFERWLSGQRRYDPGGRSIPMGSVREEAAGVVWDDSGFYPAKPNDCI